MPNLKNKISYLFLSVLFISVYLVVGIAVNPPTLIYAQTDYAGCPGSIQQGPPSAGTVCLDGSIPLKDGTLPLGCPGSAAVGPVGADYTVVCPARPGRSECTYTQSTHRCITASGKDVTNGGTDDGTTPGDTKAAYPPKFVKNDCQGDIKAGVPKYPDGSYGPGHCGILDILTLLIKILSGLVGVVVVAMIVMGGIQYSASGGEAAGVAAAKKRITSAILALVLYFFAFAILQYLIPGGVIQ